LYILDVKVLELSTFAETAPYHAALVTLRPEWRDQAVLHRHADFCELMLVLSGSGRHRVNGSTVIMHKHDLAFVRSHDQHAIDPVGDAGFVFINLAVWISTWDQAAEVCGADQSAWIGPLPPTVPLPADRAARVEREFRLALAAFSGSPQLVDVIPALVVAMAELRPERPSTRDSGATKIGTPPAWLETALREMRQPEHLAEGLPALVRLASVSHAHLARTMRLHYDTTPVDFITQLRLERASLLLTTTDVPVTAIAADCGFNSASYFARQFNRKYGHSAREHRARPQRVVAPT